MMIQLGCWSTGVLITVGMLQMAVHVPMTNVALDKPYKMSVAPNYSATLDEGDKTDLTDGFSDPQLSWGNKSTVGWEVRRKAIEITIDLGRVEPIAGVSFSCVAGAAGVTWPLSINVTVSEDGEVFYPACELYRATEDPLPPGYGDSHPYTFRSRQLETKGRYVRFSAVPSGAYLFCDEIEVYRGDDRLLARGYDVEPATGAELTDSVRLTKLGCYRRIRRDLEQVEAMVRDVRPPDSDQLLARLTRVRSDLEASDFPEDIESFKAIVPLNEIHARVFEVYCALLSRPGDSAITVWHTPRYHMLSLFETPGDPVSELTLAMARNERRAQVFNITNTSQEPVAVRFAIEGLPGGTNPVYLKPHQVEYVDGRESEVIASALVPLDKRGDEFESTVPSGMTRQIWLSADWPDVEAGEYEGEILLHWGGDRASIDFKLSIAPVRLPDKLDCDLGLWDYVSDINRPRYGVTEQNQTAAITDMNEHKVNVVWGEGRSVPQIRSLSREGEDVWEFDEQGNLAAEFDYTGWDAFVKMWPRADYFLVSCTFRDNAVFCGQKEGTDAFDRAVSQFASNWAEHNRTLGLRPGQAGILFVDEPGNEGMYKTTYLFAKAFKAGTDEIAFYSDPGIDGNTRTIDDIKYAREALELCDILCPNLTNTILQLDANGQDFFRRRQADGAVYWVYQCHGPTRLGNPSYFRFQAWHCLRYGATGVNFWSYSSLGAMNGWNEYPSWSARTDAPPYFSPESVTTSKHWEAILESRQDYQYVKMLEARVAELNEADVKSPNLGEARRLTEGVVNSVLDELAAQYGRWYGAKLSDDPSAIAEKGRLEVLAMLTSLQREN